MVNHVIRLFNLNHNGVSAALFLKKVVYGKLKPMLCRLKMHFIVIFCCVITVFFKLKIIKILFTKIWFLENSFFI